MHRGHQKTNWKWPKLRSAGGRLFIYGKTVSIAALKGRNGLGMGAGDAPAEIDLNLTPISGNLMFSQKM
jgi:hypothetical protein